jgi:hypothetical protein
MLLPATLRRALTRPSGVVVATASLASLAFLFWSQVDGEFPVTQTFDPEPFWNWRQIVELLAGNGKPQRWNTVCQQAVDKEMKVAVYDFTNFHEGEWLYKSVAVGC